MSTSATTETPPRTVTRNATQTQIQRYSFPSPTSRPTRTRSLTQLIDTAETLYSCLMDEKLTAVERSALARALCDVDKRIRAWKGLPDPAPLRVGELAMVKRAKRGKGAPLVDLPAAAQTFMESAAAKGEQLDDDAQAPEVNTSESKAPKPPTPAPKRRAATPSKESL